jgi:serine/arginine repetitive matrix protein 2
MTDKNCIRSADDLALTTSHLKELEEVSRAARHARNQLAQTLCVESVKSHDLMHKYAKDAKGRSGRLVSQSACAFDVTSSNGFPKQSTIVGDNSSFHRGLIWVGVVVQIVFVLAMWR